MAHTQGTTPRLQRLSALVAIALVAIAVGFAFGRILVGHGATYRMIGVGLASGVLAWATERRGMLLATLVSAVALLLALTWLAVPNATWHALPTLITVRSLGTLATLVGQQAREYVSPAPATPALVMAGVIAVWAAVFSCYALAFRAQSPLLALVPPIALVVFADSVLDHETKPVYGVLFLIAALAVLFADSLRRIRAWGPVWSPVADHDRLLPVAGSNARRVGATALVVAALAPLFVPGFGTTSVLDISKFGSDHGVHISPLVQMGAILRDPKNNNTPVFQVHADMNQDPYWRMVALDTFDGNSWQETSDPGTQVTDGSIQPPPATGVTVHQDFTILSDLDYSWLVAGGNPTSIGINHDVWWHPVSSSLTMDGWPDKGETYQVDSIYANPTPDDLRRQGNLPVGDGTYIRMPAIPSIVKRHALRWTAGETNDYDRVMAIMRHLLVTGGFTYDSTVQLEDDPQSLVTFLNQRRGFCQQFASLMAVMLREIGIPARVELGFTQGQPVQGQTGTYVVTGQDLHSWVEVPFNGYGWLTFDPTPGFAGASTTATGYSQIYTQCTSEQGQDTCGSGPIKKHHHKGTVTTGPFGGKKNDTNLVQGTSATPTLRRALGGITLSNLVTIAAVLGLLLAIGIPLLHWLRRRRRLHTAHDPRGLILATYDVFTDRARELGVGRSPDETPEEFRRKLAGADKLDGAAASLNRMTTEVVRAAYAAEDPDAAAAASVRRDADEVLHAMRAATPMRERVIGRYRSG